MCSDDHEFNWVRARLGCSPVSQFELIKDYVRKDIEEMQESLPPNANLQYTETHSHSFKVERWPVEGGKREHGVVFYLEGGHILITNRVQGNSFKVTVNLDDKGRCTYRIDGDGEYLRWQVIRKALEPLFFSR